jgi:hypothetical protein
MIRKIRVTSLCFISFSLFFACDSKASGRGNPISPQSSTTAVTQGEGFEVSIPRSELVDARRITYGGKDTIDIFVFNDSHNKEEGAQIFITRQECKIPNKSKQSFKAYVSQQANIGENENGIKVIPTLSHAVTKVPVTSNPEYMIGYQFEWKRNNSKERLIYLADLIEHENACLVIKVSAKENVDLDNGLLGDVIHKISETAVFK